MSGSIRHEVQRRVKWQTSALNHLGPAGEAPVGWSRPGERALEGAEGRSATEDLGLEGAENRSATEKTASTGHLTMVAMCPRGLSRGSRSVPDRKSGPRRGKKSVGTCRNGLDRALSGGRDVPGVPTQAHGTWSGPASTRFERSCGNDPTFSMGPHSLDGSSGRLAKTAVQEARWIFHSRHDAGIVADASAFWTSRNSDI
jgi:hypothetical protein